MKLRTSNDFQDFLDRDYAWRIRELNAIKQSIASTSGITRATLLRAAVPILYAHWEGFVKSASEGLLCFVSMQRKLYRELKPCFIVLAISGELDGLGSSHKVQRQIASLEFVLKKIDQVSAFGWQNKIRTRSNLSSAVFANIATSLGIGVERYSTRFQLIDESLLSRRNKIAHGEYLDIDEVAYRKLADEVLEIMRWFKTDLENFVALKAYLAKSA